MDARASFPRASPHTFERLRVYPVVVGRLTDWLYGRDLDEKALTATPAVREAIRTGRTSTVPRLGGTNQRVNEAFQRGQSATYGFMYDHQPAVRKVVDYVARNLAQLGLKLYERVGDTERERREDHPAAQAMVRPDGQTPRFHWIFRFAVDFLIFDNAYALKMRSPDGLWLYRIPPERMTVHGGGLLPDFYRIWALNGGYMDRPPEDIFHWWGSNAEDPLYGMSKLETLRQTLTEEAVAQTATVELLRNQLQGGHIERPLEAPLWSEEARNRFREDLSNMVVASPRLRPVLEEGMKWVNSTVSPKDAEVLSGRRFTTEEVCHAYGVPPDAFNATDEEQRRAVYADVLPPYAMGFTCQLDKDLLWQEFGADDYYFEMDLNAKLRGDIEKRYAAITASVGAPWKTRNEARAGENLPAVEDGDDLITPLNVTTGDPPKPAPNVMPAQDPNEPPQDGSYREQTIRLEIVQEKAQMPQLLSSRRGDLARQEQYIGEAQQVMRRYYRRMARSLTGKANGDGRFDPERWTRELATELLAFFKSVFGREGQVYVTKLMGSTFDMGLVERYLEAMAGSMSEGMVDATERMIDELGLQGAMDHALSERVDVAGVAVGARATVAAREEAAKQSPGYEHRTKTWVANTDRHASLDGETVGIEDDFSEGFSPGSPPHCGCTMSVN